MANELCSEFGASLAAITDHPKPNSQLIFLNVSCPLSPFQHLDFWLQYTMGTITIININNQNALASQSNAIFYIFIMAFGS